jgi:hypothetical protein
MQTLGVCRSGERALQLFHEQGSQPYLSRFQFAFIHYDFQSLSYDCCFYFSLFRLLFFSYFLFLYRHGVDDYLFLVYFQQSPWQTKLVDTFKLAVTLDGRPTRFDRLERCDTYTFILSVIESASSRGYDYILGPGR